MSKNFTNNAGESQNTPDKPGYKSGAASDSALLGRLSQSKKPYKIFLPTRRSHPLLFAAGSVALIIAFGTFGYCFLEDWTVFDSFYMTIVTLSTVGFGEVHKLSNPGRLFTAFLIISGVGVATYSFSAIVRLIIEGELQRIRGINRMRRKIEKFKEHNIVCGYGRLGRIVVRELLDAGQDVVVIELDPQVIDELERDEIPLIVGSAYQDECLHAAGIMRAKTLLSLLSNDAENVYVTLCARDINPELTIVARTEDEEGESRLKRAGANQVVAPYRVLGNRVVQRLIRPNVSDFLELAASKHGHQLVIEEVVVPNESLLAGQTLGQSDLRNKTGAVIAALIAEDGQMVFNPGAKSVIQAGSTMIVLGEKDSLERLSELL